MPTLHDNKWYGLAIASPDQSLGGTTNLEGQKPNYGKATSQYLLPTFFLTFNPAYWSKSGLSNIIRLPIFINHAEKTYDHDIFGKALATTLNAKMKMIGSIEIYSNLALLDVKLVSCPRNNFHYSEQIPRRITEGQGGLFLISSPSGQR